MLMPTNALMKLLLDGALKNVVAGSYQGPMFSPWVGLIVGQFTPSATLDFPNITQANYTGYARLQIAAWSPDYLSQDGSWSVTSLTDIFFQPTGPIVTQNVCSGYFLASAVAAGILLASELFPNPVPMQALTDGLNLTVNFKRSALQNIGNGVWAN